MKPMNDFKKNYKSNKEVDSDKEHRINFEIRVPKILLIDENDEKQGITYTKDAIFKAQNLGLDLVEVAPQAQPPVCKIMDYNKYIYHLKKKKKKNENSNRVEDHEIRITPSIADHDLMVKAKKVKEFLEDNCKVRIQVKLEGRERYIPNISESAAKRLAELLSDCSKIEFSNGQYTLVPFKQ